MKRTVGFTLTILAAAVAAVIGWRIASTDLDERTHVGDRVQAAVDGLRTSHLYVDPDSADRLTAADQSKLAESAAATRPSTYVIVWADTRQGGYESTLEAVQQVATELNAPGRYLVLEGDDATDRDVGIDADYVMSSVDEDKPTKTSEETTAKLQAQIAAGADRDFSTTSISHSQYWAGTGGAIAAGVLMGVLIGLALALILAIAWSIAYASLRSRS